MTWKRYLQTSFAKCRAGGQGVSALGRGVQGLLGGVTAGVTGVVRAPLQGYNDGSGVVAGNPCLHLLLATAALSAACSSKPSGTHDCQVLLTAIHLAAPCLVHPAAHSVHAEQL